MRQEAFQKPYSTAFTAAVEEGSCIPAVVAEGCPSFAAVGSVAVPSSAGPTPAVVAAAAVGWAAVAKPAEAAVAVEVEPDFEGSGVAA